MVDVPERIVLLPRETLGLDRRLNDYIASQPSAIEFVRADLYAALEAQLAELAGENARLRAERDVAVAAMVRNNERAEAAESRLAEVGKALEPFAEIAGEVWADGSGWTNAACQNDRICDWFGPSAFYAARRAREGGEVDG